MADGDEVTDAAGGSSASLISASSLSGATGESAQAAMTMIGDAVKDLTREQVALAESMDRQLKGVTDLRTAIDDLYPKADRIGDAAAAEESARSVGNRIVSQAGVSVQMQATMAPDRAGELLK